jgi:xylose dehydrogenase (NAD/NADP)
MQDEFFSCKAISTEHSDPDKITRITKDSKNTISIFNSHEDLIKSKLVDAVIISNSNTLHGSLVALALTHKIHVLCEKPLCTNPDELKRLLKAKEGSNALLLTAFMYRFHPQWKYIKDFFLKIQKQKWLISGTFQYSLNSHRVNPYNFLRGGALKDAGCYLLDLLDFLNVGEISNIYKFSELDEQSAIDFSTRLLLSFDSGQTSDFYCSVNKSQFQEVKIFGEKEHIVIESPFVIPKNKSPQIFHKDENGKNRTIRFSATDCFKSQLEHFDHSIRTNIVESRFTDGINNSQTLIEILLKKNSIL